MKVIFAIALTAVSLAATAAVTPHDAVPQTMNVASSTMNASG